MGKQFIVSLRHETGEKLKELRGMKTWSQVIDDLIDAKKIIAPRFRVIMNQDVIEIKDERSISLEPDDLIALVMKDDTFTPRDYEIFVIITGIQKKIKDGHAVAKIKYKVVNI